MLKRSYNWIRNHITPPSLLFRNRLFIERDSNHHRVLFTFGLTFRNSKWSDYRRSNVSGLFVRSFRTLIQAAALTLFLALLLVSASKYGLFLNLTTKSASALWFLGDAAHYAHIVVFAFWLTSIQSLVESAYTTTLGTFLPRPATPSSTSTEASGPHKVTSSRVFYAWLTSSNGEVGSDLTNVYPSASSSASNPFFKSLFEASDVISTTKWSISDLNLALKTPGPSLTESELLGGHDFALHSSVTLLGDRARRAASTKSPSLWALNARTTWAVTQISNPSNAGLRTAPKGAFSLPVSDFTTLTNLTANYRELNGLQESLDAQTTSAKWSRWLYKYNLLHRNVLLSSHKNTLTKRLLNSGFYDSALYQRNPNTKSITALHTNAHDFFNRGFLETYANFLPTATNSHNAGLQLDYATQLSHHESSYFWFVKRFYMFNTLPTLSRVSGLQEKIPNTASTSAGSIDFESTANRLVRTKDLPYFNVLRSLRNHSSLRNRSASSDSTLVNSTAVTNTADIFDYDFTESALGLFTNQLNRNSENKYYSNIFSDYSALASKSTSMKIKKL